MRVAPAAVAQHARDIRVCSVLSDLEDWIRHCEDQGRGTGPEAEIARAVHLRLFELSRRMEPALELLAIREAEREAAIEAEIADYDREAM